MAALHRQLRPGEDLPDTLRIDKNKSRRRVFGVTIGGAFFGVASGVIAQPAGDDAHPVDRLLSPPAGALTWPTDGDRAAIMDLAGRLRAVLAGHAAPIRGAARLPDGRIATWSDAASIRLWRLPDDLRAPPSDPPKRK